LGTKINPAGGEDLYLRLRVRKTHIVPLAFLWGGVNSEITQLGVILVGRSERPLNKKENLKP
jgi:hypothetical protein